MKLTFEKTIRGLGVGKVALIIGMSLTVFVGVTVAALKFIL